MSKGCRDHLGNEFKSISEMCRFHGVNVATFRNRYLSGHDLRICLSTKTISSYNNKCCEDHLGNNFESIGAMCEFYGVSQQTYSSRKESGHSLEVCLTGKGLISRKIECTPCNDHLGNTFSSITEMCKYWGVNKTTFLRRHRKGYCLNYSLTGKGIKKGLSNF